MVAAAFPRKFAARLGLFAPRQFFGEHFGKLFRRDRAAVLDVNHVRRKTAELIPRDHVVRRAPRISSRVNLTKRPRAT